MSWKNRLESWLADNVQPVEDFEDVRNWLLSDETWNPYLSPIRKGGSHEYTLYVQGMSQLRSKWTNDTLSICKTKGNKIKKWQIVELVESYRILQEADRPAEDQDEPQNSN